MRMRRIFLLLACCLLWQWPGAANAQPHIFVVHSYHQDYVWVQAINRGIQESLRGQAVSIESFYLDAMRDHDPEHLRAKAEAIFARIEAEKPQLVIAADDAAQEYLVAPLLKGRETPQVIFCGVNAPLTRYGFPAGNVSGVRERWHFREGFGLLKRIKPSLRTVILLTDDSESSGFVLSDLAVDRKQSGHMALRLLKVEQVHTFQQWQRALKAAQAKADALAIGLYHSLVDETTGKVVPAEQVSAWSSSVLRKPSLGFADYAKAGGLLCGILEAGEEQGFLAGSMVRQLLERGGKAGALPVRINKQGMVLLNLKTAQRLGIVIPFEIISAAGIVVK
jgi:ABC-type uncharacterized transport system substrate-binding protein